MQLSSEPGPFVTYVACSVLPILCLGQWVIAQLVPQRYRRSNKHVDGQRKQ